MNIVNSQNWIPKKIFLTKGKGVSKERLTSFELALREAGIASLNLITVSSILPPKCEFISQEQGTELLSPGQVVPVVLARSDSNKFGDLVSSGVGVAIPKDNDHYGYLSEHHCTGMDRDAMEEYVEDLAAEMLATTPLPSSISISRIFGLPDRISIHTLTSLYPSIEKRMLISSPGKS